MKIYFFIYIIDKLLIMIKIAFDEYISEKLTEIVIQIIIMT